VNRNWNLDKSDTLLVLSFIILLIGLNFSYFFHTENFYLPVLTIISFFEIQIQLFLVLKMIKKRNLKETKEMAKAFLIISLGLAFIIIFFPIFSFPEQVLFFVRVFQFAYLIALLFDCKREYLQIQLSVWFIIVSNILLLIDLVIFDYKYEYALIMSLFYYSKWLFLDGYLEWRNNKFLKTN
jgi:hypothetical protein